MPLLDYQAYPHSGGTLVAGILTTPLFMLLGPSLISLKVLPLLFSLGTLLLWYFFLIKYADKEVTYRSLAEMKQILHDMEVSLGLTKTTTRLFANFNKGLE